MIKLKKLIKEASISSYDKKLIKKVREIVGILLKKEGGYPGKESSGAVRGYRTQHIAEKGDFTFFIEKINYYDIDATISLYGAEDRDLKKVARTVNRNLKKLGIDSNLRVGVGTFDQTSFWKVKQQHGLDGKEWDKVEKVLRKY